MREQHSRSGSATLHAITAAFLRWRRLQCSAHSRIRWIVEEVRRRAAQSDAERAARVRVIRFRRFNEPVIFAVRSSVASAGPLSPPSKLLSA